MAVRAPVELDLLLVGEAPAVVERALDRADESAIRASVETVSTLDAARTAVEDDRHDCVVVSAIGADVDVETGVERLRAADPDQPIVAVVDDAANLAPAVAAGGTDAISRDLVEEDPGLLVDRIRRAVETAPGSAIPGSRNWYEALLADSMDALTVLDADGAISYQNPSVERLLGYDPEALVGTDSLSYVHPDDRERVQETFTDLYEQGDGATADLEFRFRAADDTWEWLESRVTTWMDRGIEGYVVNSSVITERKEREREVERYETLLSVIPDTIAITDLEGVHLDIYGFEGWSGYEREDLVGEPVSLTMDEADIERAEEIVTDLILAEDREKATYETRLQTSGGEWVPFENHVTPLPPDDDGNIPGVMNVLRNISDRKDRDRRLQQAETVFQNVKDGVFLADVTEDDRFVFQRVNEAYEEMTDLAEAEIRGRTPSDVIGDPDITAIVEEEMADAVESRSPIHDERRFDTPDGPTYWESWIAPVVVDDEVVSLVGVLRDVTDRTERQQELHLKNRAMDEAPIGILITEVTDSGSMITYANEGYEQLTGYERTELQGNEWWASLIGPQTDDETLEALGAAFQAERAASTEMLLYRSDGAPRWFQLSLSPVSDEDGEVTHYVSFQQDITDRKEYETEIERRFDEFADVFTEDLREPIEQAHSSVDAARTNGDEGALEDATEWLQRADDLLEDLATVHSFSVPSRDHSESALRGSVDED